MVVSVDISGSVVCLPHQPLAEDCHEPACGNSQAYDQDVCTQPLQAHGTLKGQNSEIIPFI